MGIPQIYKWGVAALWLAVLASMSAIALHFSWFQRDARTARLPQQVARASELGRVAVIGPRDNRVQVLAIAVSPKPSERAVLVRDLSSGSIRGISIGDQIYSRGPKVTQIGRGQVHLAHADGRTKIVRLSGPLR